ncbi:hypothetical protein OG762_43385 [Streptomyces sp. NBC_01136]|uniref:hypothetical protein n=1 Tax=unclassified Streptomyces TaxID=2593676 RepID=UPI00324DAAAA|nr:hypothetical protein OG762_43385 [Streptomyces sp. NBC_01136]
MSEPSAGSRVAAARAAAKAAWRRESKIARRQPGQGTGVDDAAREPARLSTQ